MEDYRLYTYQECGDTVGRTTRIICYLRALVSNRSNKLFEFIVSCIIVTDRRFSMT